MIFINYNLRIKNNLLQFKINRKTKFQYLNLSRYLQSHYSISVLL